MPPKSGKKTTPGSGGKRGGRAARPTPKKATRQEISEEPAKLVEVPVQAKESVKAEELVVEKHVEVESVTKAADTEGNSIVSMNKEDEAKESVQEYERGERLDLEDNEPEYDPEEYGGGDYDEKEIEQEDVREQGEDVEEELEEHVHDEDEGDVVEEEMDDVREDLEGEEDDERVGEEHAELAEAEEQEHHDVFKERRKRKEFEVFVGGLDKDATEDDLRKVFGEVGEVTEVRLMMNPQTKKNKGFAFLRFATIEQAKRACSDLKNAMINGKQCGVTPSQDSDTLFLGNICKTWTKEALKEKLKQYGVNNVEDLTLVEDSNNEGMNRGFAFLEFSSPSDAMDSYKRLQKRDVVFGVDRPAKVSFADSFIDPGDEIMAQVKTVFVDGLLPSWDEDHVRELLKKYGEIEKIELARNMPSAKRKDFGFISFDTHDAALTCAKSINNAELGEGENKAKVRARLSRPLERGKGKHVPRGGDFRPRYSSSRGFRAPWGRPVPPRGLPVRSTRGIRGRLPPIDRGLKRPIAYRDRRPVMAMPPRGRPVSPYSRSYGRRPPVPSYPKSSLKRDYGRLEELPPRSRADPDYRTRVSLERHESSYRDNYSSRGSGYVDLPPRGTARPSSRRAYVDDGYDQRFERLPPSYREGRSRDYDSLSGSKRPYAVLDDVPPRYAEAPIRQSRPRLDYELGGIASPYGDAYSDRLGRSNVGYGSSNRGSMSRDSHGLYSSRQGMGYGEGSYSGSDVGGMYPSSYSSDYMSRGGDIVGSSYSSVYSGRSSDGSSYMGGSGRSGSYY